MMTENIDRQINIIGLLLLLTLSTQLLAKEKNLKLYINASPNQSLEDLFKKVIKDEVAIGPNSDSYRQTLTDNPEINPRSFKKYQKIALSLKREEADLEKIKKLQQVQNFEISTEYALISNEQNGIKLKSNYSLIGIKYRNKFKTKNIFYGKIAMLKFFSLQRSGIKALGRQSSDFLPEFELGAERQVSRDVQIGGGYEAVNYFILKGAVATPEIIHLIKTNFTYQFNYYLHLKTKFGYNLGKASGAEAGFELMMKLFPRKKIKTLASIGGIYRKLQIENQSETSSQLFFKLGWRF